MEDILVLSSDYSFQDRSRLLVSSAAKHKVPLHVFGIDQEYPQHPGPKKTIERGIAFLKERTEQYVVITDGFDVLVTRWNPAELIMMIDSAPHLIISVEWWVWPEGPWKAAYQHLDGRYNWFAINGGQYCGRRDQLIAMWEYMVGIFDRESHNSQRCLHRMYQDGAAFTLDLECRIFQSMYGPHDHMIVVQDGQAFNAVTGSNPMFLHFNGGAKGIERWNSALNACDAVSSV